MSEDKPTADSSDGIWMAIIIIAGIIALACIGAFTALSIAFFANAPW